MSSYEPDAAGGVPLDELIEAFKKAMARSSQRTAKAAIENPSMLYGRRAIYGVQDLTVTLKAGFHMPSNPEGGFQDRVLVSLAPSPESAGEITFTVSGRMNETPENRPNILISAVQGETLPVPPAEEVPGGATEYRLDFYCCDRKGDPLTGIEVEATFFGSDEAGARGSFSRRLLTSDAGIAHYTLYWNQDATGSVFYLPPGYRQRKTNRVEHRYLIVQAQATHPETKEIIRERAPTEIYPRRKE